MAILRLFRDGSRLELGKGHLDQWSVYLARPHAPKALAPPSEWLGRLEGLVQCHSGAAVYADFTVVYNRVSHEIKSYVFDLIHVMARSYGVQSLDAEVALAMGYAGMATLEQRHRSRPGVKRHLRLAAHLLLAEGWTACDAVSFGDGKTPAEIVAECAARGF
jgi:hypothetical protein